MKIIKKGNPNTYLKPQKHTCYSCGCKFEYTNADIRADMDGKYVICPMKECGKFNQVNY